MEQADLNKCKCCSANCGRAAKRLSLKCPYCGAEITNLPGPAEETESAGDRPQLVRVPCCQNDCLFFAETLFSL